VVAHTTAATPIEDLARHTRLARRLLDASAAVVALRAQETVTFNSVSLAPGTASLPPAAIADRLFASTMAQPEPLVLADARLDVRFNEHPTVRDGRLIAYVGAPLYVNGKAAGIFCAIDDKPRTWSEDDLEVLQVTTAAIAAELTLREHSAPEAKAGEPREIELQLESLFNVSSVGMALLDPSNRRFTRVNQAFCDITGYSEAELMGAAVDQLNHPAEREINHRLYSRLAHGDSAYEIEKRYVRKDGKIVWVHATGNVIRDSQGRASRALAVIQDITARKRAEEILRASEAQLRLITETLPVYVMRCDTQLRYLFVNAAYAERFGLKPEDVIGKRIPDVLGAPVYEVTKPYLDRLLAGEAVQYETTIPYTGLGRRFMRSAGVPDLDEAGKVRGFIGVLIDLTDRKLAEDTLKEADRRKNEFLAMLAHELRNPLAPLRNAAALIEHLNEVEPSVRVLTQMIERQVKHMARLVDDLLDVARVTQGKITLKKETLDLESAIRTGIELARPLIDAKNHRLKVSLLIAPVLISGDATRLSQVVGNLLNNAAKYTPHGGEIRIEVERIDDEVAIHVRDNGVGIDPALLPRVFELFTQGDRSLDRSQGGLGIGLALVKSLVELHGGRVTATSTGSGQGSQFSVYLPLAVEVSGRERASDSYAASQPLRILVVDDNVDSTDSLRMLLEMSGHQVRCAYDGPVALQTASFFNPDVILLDLGLPGMHGYEVARRLRAMDSTRHPHLIALTGYGSSEDEQRSLEAGFEHHLVKPLDCQTLNSILAALDRTRAKLGSATVITR